MHIWDQKACTPLQGFDRALFIPIHLPSIITFSWLCSEVLQIGAADWAKKLLMSSIICYRSFLQFPLDTGQSSSHFILSTVQT